jgi:hypothetical protein
VGVEYVRRSTKPLRPTMCIGVGQGLAMVVEAAA